MNEIAASLTTLMMIAALALVALAGRMEGDELE
jgi:hypothetical protein